MPDGEAPVPRPTTGAILHKTARGVGWIIGWRTVKRLLGLVNTVALARLLIPADFGLVALGTALAGSLQALSSIGVEDALVREAVVDRGLYDTGFTLNLIRSLGTAAFLFAGAWPAATYFGDPRLTLVILALACGTLCGGLVNIGIVDYRRNLDFRKEFVLLSMPRLVAIVITIGVAIEWQTYWALLAGILTNSVLATAFSYIMHPYRPRLSLSRWRDLAGFSFWTWAIGVATAVRDRAVTLLIGHNLGESDVGTYVVGCEIGLLPMSEFLGPLGRACFSGFAAARHADGDPAQPYLRVVGVTFLVGLPMAVGIAAVADPTVRLLLGTRWLAAVPIVRVLGLLSVTGISAYLSEVMLSANGHLKLIFRILVGFALARVGILVLVMPHYGLMGAVYTMCIGASVENVVWTAMTFRKFKLHLTALWVCCWRSAVAASVMAFALQRSGLGWTVATGSHLMVFWHLVTPIMVGMTTYAVILIGLWFLSGTPDGPERDVLTLLRQQYRGARNLRRSHVR